MHRVRVPVSTLAAGLAVLALALGVVACGGGPTRPAMTPTPAPSRTVVAVPANATTAQIDACLAQAVATGHGTWVVFPAGKFAYAGAFVVPDYINVSGQGIWDQGSSDGAGGTWLEASSGMRWGSYSTVSDLLVGENSAATCQFYPVARGSSAAGSFTQAHGSQHDTFDLVRFKGGSNTGAGLLDLGNNFDDSWADTWRGTDDMTYTTFDDCEFERPQSTNAVDGTSGSLGRILDIWWDSRAGGSQFHDVSFNRCHFGVKNGYHSGIDGYGVGGTILFQPSPAEHAPDGPRPSGAANNMSFDWSQVTHGAYDITFTDCLFEYALWYPMDICDYARSYSLTNLFNGRVGADPPTSTRADAIPDRIWNIAFSMAHCYMKGSFPVPHGVVGELGKDCTFSNDFCGTGSVFTQAGSFGNVVSGSFADGSRPVTAIFPRGAAYDWRGVTTRYTPSPYDP